MIKLFAHRGYVENNIKQNSIASLKNAVKNQFKGVEFDVWNVNNDLIISHDKPKSDPLNLLPKFKDYLIFKNQIEYWIDFKNLDLKNIEVTLKILEEEILKANIDFDRIFFAPYITNYDLLYKIIKDFRDYFKIKINIVGVCDNKSQISEIVDLIDIQTLDYISIDYRLIDASLLKLIDPNKIFAWTVNDIKIINDLYMLGVNKFATDNVKL